MSQSAIDSKLEAANSLIINHITNNYNSADWRYQDYVIHNRFFDEAKEDESLNLTFLTAEEIANYAIDKINEMGILELAQFLSIGRL